MILENRNNNFMFFWFSLSTSTLVLTSDILVHAQVMEKSSQRTGEVPRPSVPLNVRRFPRLLDASQGLLCLRVPRVQNIISGLLCLGIVAQRPVTGRTEGVGQHVVLNPAVQLK